MNVEMTQEEYDLRMKEQEAAYTKAKHESIWVQIAEAQMSNEIRSVERSMEVADQVLEGFKLRFEDTVGGMQ